MRIAEKMMVIASGFIIMEKLGLLDELQRITKESFNLESKRCYFQEPICIKIAKKRKNRE